MKFVEHAAIAAMAALIQSETWQPRPLGGKTVTAPPDPIAERAWAYAKALEAARPTPPTLESLIGPPPPAGEYSPMFDKDGKLTPIVGFAARGNGEDAIQLTMTSDTARDLLAQFRSAPSLMPATRRVMASLEACLTQGEPPEPLDD